MIGLLSAEQWPETEALAQKFEILPHKTAVYAGQRSDEIDLGACLKRLPQLILIDELSHLNADDSRHAKRYQDIEELLKAGMDVYPTLDVQHIESIQDSVSSILESPIRDRIPEGYRRHDPGTDYYIPVPDRRLPQRTIWTRK